MSCLPAHLQKYQQKENLTKSTNDETTVIDQASTLDPEWHDSESSKEKSQSLGFNQPKRLSRDVENERLRLSSQTFFFQTDQNTFRLKFHPSDVWETLLDVLIKNYSLAIVDKNAGVLATDWDSFYIGKKVYRNKLSIRVKKTPLNGEKVHEVEFVIHNNVEKLGELPQGNFGLSMVWLPAHDPIDEVTRVIQNMALLLKIPPPPKLYDQESFTSKSNSGGNLR